MRIPKKLRDKLVNLHTSRHGDDGLEYPNPNPLYVEIGPPRLTLQEQIKRVVQQEVSRHAYDQEMETLEEFEDFDVPDEMPFPVSEFEFEEMEEDVPPVVSPDPEDPVAGADPLPDPGVPDPDPDPQPADPATDPAQSTT